MPQQFIILIVAALALLVIGGISFLSGREIERAHV